MQMLAIFLLALQLFLGSALSPGELHLSSASRELVTGCYTNTFGNEIVFAIKSSGFHVTDQDNNTIVSVDTLGENRRLIEIKGSIFVQERSSRDTFDYYIPPQQVGILRAAYGKDNAARWGEVVRQAERLDNDESILQQSLSSLVADPGFMLLASAARAIGEKGFTGIDYPILLPFYVTAMKLSELADKFSGVQPSANHFKAAGSEPKSQTCISYDTCPPCQENQCLGLCGKGCDCWRFVCGDCCYHQGCYDHDLCCEKFFRVSCLFPFSFSCTSYSC